MTTAQAMLHEVSGFWRVKAALETPHCRLQRDLIRSQVVSTGREPCGGRIAQSRSELFASTHVIPSAIAPHGRMQRLGAGNHT